MTFDFRQSARWGAVALIVALSGCTAWPARNDTSVPLATRFVRPSTKQSPASATTKDGNRSNAESSAAEGSPAEQSPGPKGQGFAPPAELEFDKPATAVIRGQTPAGGMGPSNTATPGRGDYLRYPMQPSGAPLTLAQNDQGTPIQPFNAPQNGSAGSGWVNEAGTSPLVTGPPVEGEVPFGQPTTDITVNVEETRTGRFMFGAGVNSDLGVTGQIVIDERNFDPLRFPSSFEDIVNGTAWRGAGQGFRLEAMPGSQVHRYLLTHTVPYVYLPGIPEPFVLSSSGFFYTRSFFDWNEQRLGGRIALGYRITQDLSLTGAVRAENVKIFDPRFIGFIPELDRVVGDNDLYSGRLTLTHDTRDNAFLATQGHLFEISYEQTFGSFDYPRGELDYRQYFLMRERPDGSGRHTLAYSFRVGVSGAETPLYENYFSGGFSTMRGFDFRGASPLDSNGFGVVVGGQFRFLGSMEYFFPITADDMIKGVFFVDFGTTEAQIAMDADNFRVSPGFGLRINIPAMGPAPLALDLAVPVAHAPGDNIQNFSFFFGFSR